jgi:predicted metal-dependent enzyme (double-stranded beta helix superfamily)
MREDSESGLSRRSFTSTLAIAAAHLAMPARSSAGRAKFDVEQFVADCVAANSESDPQGAVLEVLQMAVHDSRSVFEALGPLGRAGISVLHRSSDLTIFNAVWTPQMNLMPHNHLMWANIGIYAGREDNIFWKESDAGIEAFGAEALFEGDSAPLPTDAIHSVTNPLLRFTGGIHIYGGDFFDTTRAQWDPETLVEEPSDGEAIREMFRRENERLNL